MRVDVSVRRERRKQNDPILRPQGRKMGHERGDIRDMLEDFECGDQVEFTQGHGVQVHVDKGIIGG